MDESAPPTAAPRSFKARFISIGVDISLPRHDFDNAVSNTSFGLSVQENLLRTGGWQVVDCS
jgi:hypothetical protein